MRQLLLSLAFALRALRPRVRRGTRPEPQAAPGSIAIGMIEQVGGDGASSISCTTAASRSATRAASPAIFRSSDGGRLFHLRAA